MKFKPVQIKYILIIILLVAVNNSVTSAQEPDTIPAYKPRTYLGINIGITKTTIINPGIGSLSDLSTISKNSYSGSFEFGHNFSKSFGLSIGLGFSSYSTELSLINYSNKFNTTDSENEPYERRIEGSDIIENQKISLLSLPLSFTFSLPVGKKGGFFLQPVFSLSIPVIRKYNSSGTFTYTGFYPAYNVILQDLPSYGFASNAIVNSDEKPDLNSIIFLGGVGAGFKHFVSKDIELLVGVNYIRSLSNIGKYPSPENFQLSRDENLINSVMGGSSKVSLQLLGINISLRYYLK